MGPPLKNHALAALQNRSRFCEGSMNDRISAAPPVHFLGPDAIAALEQPVSLLTAPSISGGNSNHQRYSQDGGGPVASSSQTWSRKTGSRLFGQVWEGVRGKLRLRRDDNDAGKTPAVTISAATTTTAVTATNVTAEGAAMMAPIDIYTDPSERASIDGPPASRTRSKAIPVGPSRSSNNTTTTTTTASGFKFTGFDTARPSKEEVLASYQQLVAEGFFQSHAIQASRQCLAPPPSEKAPPSSSSMSAMGLRPATSRGGDFQQLPQLPPQWPLASPAREFLHEPVQSPGSVSSRGTKRAAAVDDDDEDGNENDNEDDDDGDDVMSGDFDKENQAPPHPNTVKEKKVEQQPKKRLRSIASRDAIFVPKMRSSAARRSLSSSNAIASSSSSSSTTTMNKLQKRRPGPPPTTRGHFDMPLKYQQQQQSQQPSPPSMRPRHISDGGGSARVLRGGAEEHRSMRIVPDADRGIPSVPLIPTKFTYGEDRQGNGPWRGLRIR